MTQIRASAPHYGLSPCYIRISKHRVAYFPLESLAVEREIWWGGGVVAGQKPTGSNVPLQWLCPLKQRLLADLGGRQIQIMIIQFRSEAKLKEASETKALEGSPSYIIKCPNETTANCQTTTSENEGQKYER